MEAGASFNSERAGSAYGGSMYSTGSGGSGGSSGSSNAADRGSGAVCVHSKKLGHKHPEQNWEMFLGRLNQAMDDLNDPVKEAEITKKF